MRPSNVGSTILTARNEVGFVLHYFAARRMGADSRAAGDCEGKSVILALRDSWAIGLRRVRKGRSAGPKIGSVEDARERRAVRWPHAMCTGPKTPRFALAIQWLLYPQRHP